jgi:hypothetical protein
VQEAEWKGATPENIKGVIWKGEEQKRDMFEGDIEKESWK